MSQRKFMSRLLATTLVAIALFGAGCKKDEKAQEPAPAPAPAQQAAATAPTSGVANYDFESGTAGWNQSAKGISIGAATDQKHGGNSSLKISGTASGVWNFGSSPQVSLEPGKQYKLTGWVYVQAWDKSATPPLLKCGVYQNGKWIANVFTSKYNMKKINEWQMLSGKITAPADGTIAGSVSLEKGTQDAIKATVYLDDIKLELAQ